jgi:2-haloalkanoic acid dehalogenase type II
MGLSRIFFDFGGTLAKPPAHVENPWKVWLEVARKYDLHLSPTMVRHAIEAVDEKLQGEIYHYVGRTEDFWKLYDGLVMDRLRIREQRSQIQHSLEAVFLDPSNVELFPETLAVLEDLRTQGYHLGLISNHTDRLLRILKHSGLDKLLETVTYSQEVGAEKPAPQVFAKALERARCAPSEALHVRDSIEADVEGARRSGMQAVWLNRGHPDGSVDCLTIHNLIELPHILEMIRGAEES